MSCQGRETVEFGYIDPGWENVLVERVDVKTREVVEMKRVPKQKFFNFKPPHANIPAVSSSAEISSVGLT